MFNQQRPAREGPGGLAPWSPAPKEPGGRPALAETFSNWERARISKGGTKKPKGAGHRRRQAQARTLRGREGIRSASRRKVLQSLSASFGTKVATTEDGAERQLAVEDRPTGGRSLAPRDPRRGTERFAALMEQAAGPLETSMAHSERCREEEDREAPGRDRNMRTPPNASQATPGATRRRPSRTSSS